MNRLQIVSEENFEQQYVKSFEKIDGEDPVTFLVARHGGFSVSGNRVDTLTTLLVHFGQSKTNELISSNKVNQ